MKEDTNWMSSTYCIVSLQKIIFKCIRIPCFDNIHAHFIQCFNGFVDGSMFLVITSIVETGRTKMEHYKMLDKGNEFSIDKQTKYGTSQVRKQIKTYREPQWQKSEDTEKKLLGSSKYFPSNCPYAASFSALRAPTRMGTIFTGYLALRYPSTNNETSMLEMTQKIKTCFQKIPTLQIL